MKPDVVLTIADRYETLGTAMAASYMNIPLAHLQGGEQTGSIDDKVRNAITQLADWHFTSNPRAMARVSSMRFSQRGVYVTGCPSVDIAHDVRHARDTGPYDPFFKYGGVGTELDVKQPYYVLLQHPVTTHAESARAEIVTTLSALKRLHAQVFVFWPNIDTGSDAISKALREYREQMHPIGWHFFRHMEADDFLNLLCGSLALIGNSSVGIRECSYLGVPVVNIGDRQRGRDRGPNVIDVPSDSDAIVSALLQHRDSPRPRMSSLYGNGTAGEMVAELLAAVPL
jgi:UDP-hydrolysing UDP-N-acetyl-D-glucosamine 2-epimerase